MGVQGTNKQGHGGGQRSQNGEYAVELRRLQARVRRLEKTIKQLEAALPAIDVRADRSDIPLDLRWANESVPAEALAPKSFAEAWEGGSAAEEGASGTFFEMEFDEERARRWFLRGA